MKNKDIILCYKLGFGRITSHSISSIGAYSVYKFKKLINEAIEKIGNSENEIIKENKCDELYIKYNVLMQKSSLSKEESQELKEYINTLTPVFNFIEELHKDTSEIKVTLLSWEDWHSLKNENKEIYAYNSKMEILEILEPILENVLWASPQIE